jgi:hypothetical protein
MPKLMWWRAYPGYIRQAPWVLPDQEQMQRGPTILIFFPTAMSRSRGREGLEPSSKPIIAAFETIQLGNRKRTYQYASTWSILMRSKSMHIRRNGKLLWKTEFRNCVQHC